MKKSDNFRGGLTHTVYRSNIGLVDTQVTMTT